MGSLPGIPTSDPETSVQTDLAPRIPPSRMRAATYFYHYRIDDLIERYQTQTDFFFFRNRGRARLRGFEAEVQGQLGLGLSLEAGFNRRAARPRRRHVSGRHHTRDVLGSGPEKFRCPRIVRPAPHRVVWLKTRVPVQPNVAPGYTLVDAGGNRYL